MTTLTSVLGSATFTIRRRVGALTASAAALVLGVTGCATPDNSGPASSTSTSTSSAIAGPVTPDSLAAAVTADNVMTHVRALSAIAARHGGNRASGTTGYDESAEYVADTLRHAGFRVSTPVFEFPRFTSGPISITADDAPVDASVVQYSGGTGETPVVGPPVAVTALGCSATDYPPAVRGSVAVITRGTCTFAEKAAFAERAGAGAVIIVDTENGKPEGMTLDPDRRPGIPVVGVGADVGNRIRSARSMRLTVPATTTTVTSRNVIAQTATGSPSDVVIAGAHLDSVPAGPGINDNGSGTAALLETALRLGAHPTVDRAVRFAFWGAEEEGLIGSSRYVASLDPAARQAAALYLNFDMLGSPNAGYFVYDGDDSDRVGAGPGPDGSAAIERVFRRYFDGRRIPLRSNDFDGRSDYSAFIEAGIPAGGIDTGAEAKKSPEQASLWGGTANEAFDPHYHSPADDQTNINVAALAITAPAVAYSVASYAVGPQGTDGVPDVTQRHRAGG